MTELIPEDCRQVLQGDMQHVTGEAQFRNEVIRPQAGSGLPVSGYGVCETGQSVPSWGSFVLFSATSLGARRRVSFPAPLEAWRSMGARDTKQ